MTQTNTSPAKATGLLGSGPAAPNERFRLAWEMAADAMALSDPNGIVLAANPAYLRLYGYSAEQVVGQSFAIIFPPHAREWAVAVYKEYFASAETTAVVESNIQRADGAERIVESRVGYITEAGRRTAMLSVIRDITDRKHLEEGLRQAQQAELLARAGLEERVRERTAELVGAKEALEAEIASRRQLEQQLEQAREAERARLARELHDGLGGALTGLKMDLAQLRGSVSPDGQPRLAEMLSQVDETVNIMRRIASDLRPAVLDDMGLVSAVEWQVDEFRRRSNLACRLVTDVEELDLNPQLSIVVFRIVQEALTNIMRHARASLVEVHLSCRANVLRLVVADDGQGIAPERRANPTSLGVAGMHERVRLLGGELQLESAMGQGTTVRVVIPMGEPGDKALLNL